MNLPHRKHHLLALCERVHMAIHGSGDPMTDAELLGAEDAMMHRIASWTKSLPGCAEYDDAVKLLVVATMREISRNLTPYKAAR